MFSPCILIPAATGVLTSILGYFLGKFETNKTIASNNKKIEELHLSIQNLKQKNIDLNQEYFQIKDSTSSLEATILGYQKNELELKNKIEELQLTNANFKPSIAIDFAQKIEELEKRFIASTIESENNFKKKIVGLELKLQEALKQETALKQHITLLEQRLK